MDKLQLFKWLMGQGTILIGGEAIHFDEKPDLGFPYSFIHYEPDADFFDVDVDGGGQTLRVLTEAEQAACIQFVNRFIDEAHVPGSAYDPNRDNVYLGRVPRATALQMGVAWTISTCPYVVGLFDPEQSTWTKVKALITDTGHFSVDPDGICPRCTLFFTEATWAEFPKPEPLEWYYRWDFAKEQWYDSRTVDQVRDHVVAIVSNNYEARRSEIQSRYLQAYEIYSWTIQQEEAMATTVTPEESSFSAVTPFLDACLEEETAVRQMLQLPPPQTKRELAMAILTNNRDYRIASGRLHGAMRAWLAKAYALETIAELEALLAQFQAYIAQGISDE